MSATKYWFAALCVVAFVLAGTAQETAAVKQRDPRAAGTVVGRAGAKLDFGNLSFELNSGQTDESVRFLSRGRDYNVFLTATEAVLTRQRGSAAPGREMAATRASRSPRSLAHDSVVRIALVGANRRAKTLGLEELPGKTNYFIGNDPTKWRTQVPTFAKVKYESVYPGIDVIYYGNRQQLEFDFVVAPGADPDTIRLAVSGFHDRESSAGSSLRVDSEGNLVVRVDEGEFHVGKPLVYQPTHSGPRTPVQGRYSVSRKGDVRFVVGDYDHSKPLVIDPVVAYSTFLGGSSGDGGETIALDASGNMYVAGHTVSADFPLVNALQSTRGFFTLSFVTKIRADGSALDFSTYFEGDVTDIAVDAAANVYITGGIAGSTLPTKNALQSMHRGGIGDAFVAKINADGSLNSATYLGGSLDDWGLGIALDVLGNVYVTGETESVDFPVTATALQRIHGGAGFEVYNRNFDAFVAKIRNDGSSLIYSTFLGGSNFFSVGNDGGGDIAVDAAGDAYILGLTSADDFPTKNAAQGSNHSTGIAGGTDAFVSRLSTDGSTLVYSTYLGGSGTEFANGIAVNATGIAYITGVTYSADFPTVHSLQPYGGSGDTFVAGLDTTGAGPSSLVFSTYFGGNGVDGLPGVGRIAMDASGKLWVAGYTGSPNLPTTANALQPAATGNNGFIIKIKPDAVSPALLYSSYIVDGVAYDVAVAGLRVYVTGEPGPSFTTTANALQPILASVPDAFVYQMVFRPDFRSEIAPFPVVLQGVMALPFTVTSIDEFDTTLVFDIVGQPDGMTVSPAHFSLTPPINGSVSQTITVSLGPSIPAGTNVFSFVERGSSRTIPASVRVTATTAGVKQVIATLQTAGCIDNSGIVTALTGKLTEAQAQADSGQIRAALNTYGALINQVQAQSGKHIAETCGAGGVNFGTATVLIANLRGLAANLQASSVANPILGYMATSTNSAVPGTIVSILDSANAVVATATTDVTGFYFFATTDVLAAGSNYTVKVTGFPSGYSASTPAFQTLTWTGTQTSLESFVVK